MENGLIWICAVVALYYLYRKLIKKKDCDCAGKCAGTAPSTGQCISKKTLCQRGKS